MAWGINETDNFNDYTTTIGDFFLIVLIAPFFETFISQYAPLKIAGLFVKKYKYIYCYTIICISIFFGLMHPKSVLYFMITFFYGLIWSFCCLLFIRRKQHPLLFTALIHACYNGLLFGVTFLLTLIDT
jgi:membrane protease YdiL (CAAX protease family)